METFRHPILEVGRVPVASLTGSGINGNCYTMPHLPPMQYIVASLTGSGINGNARFSYCDTLQPSKSLP